GLAVTDEHVWVLTWNGWLSRISPADLHVSEGIARLGRRARRLAASGAGLWAVRGWGELVRVSPWSGATELTRSLRGGVRGILADREGEAVWATSIRGRKLIGIDPTTAESIFETRLPGIAVDLAQHDGTLWVACRHRSEKKGSLVGVNPATGQIGR